MVDFSLSQTALVVLFISIFVLLVFSEENKLAILMAGVVVISGVSYFLIDDFHLAGIFEHIDWEVILILFAMSLLVEALIELNIFDFISLKLLSYSRGSVSLLHVFLFITTFLLSAILDNITAILLMGRLTINLAEGLDIDAKPLVISEIFATESAGIASPVSSLPSIIVAVEGDVTFLDFLIIFGPLLLILTPLAIFWFHYMGIRKIEVKQIENLESKAATIAGIRIDELTQNKDRFILAIVIVFLMVFGFILVSVLPAGFPEISLAYVALASAVILVLATRLDFKTIVKRVEWDSVVFFIGLFLLVGILEEAQVIKAFSILLGDLTQGDSLIFASLMIVLTAPASAIVDNIPITAAMAPVLTDFIASNNLSADKGLFLWLILLTSVTFGAGFSPIGTATAIVGIELLRNSKNGTISLWYYIQRITFLSGIFLVISSLYIFWLFV